jgi:phosphohistidine swiveling domain-containing protein
MYSVKRALAALMIRRSLKDRVLRLEELESKHSDPEEPLFNDSSYFLGRGKDGSFMVVRLAFRPRRNPEYWLAFHLPGKGNFRLRKLDYAGEVEGGLLDDVDQVFFLTHDELGRLVKGGDRDWCTLAKERRQLFPRFFELQFEDHCQGYPEPLPEDEPGIRINGNAVKGLPVSTGMVEACIRIVDTPEDAESLEKGEIMLCRYTDVGWSPFFSLASGLITEIGSPLSHGAVVAREYGIPAVVNAKGAMGFFRTGERV